MSGNELATTLDRLGYDVPVSGLALDWLYEYKRTRPLMTWLARSIKPSNVLTRAELDAFESLRVAGRVLAGADLRAALRATKGGGSGATGGPGGARKGNGAQSTLRDGTEAAAAAASLADGASEEELQTLEAEVAALRARAAAVESRARRLAAARDRLAQTLARTERASRARALATSAEGASGGSSDQNEGAPSEALDRVAGGSGGGGGGGGGGVDLRAAIGRAARSFDAVLDEARGAATRATEAFSERSLAAGRPVLLAHLSLGDYLAADDTFTAAFRDLLAKVFRVQDAEAALPSFSLDHYSWLAADDVGGADADDGEGSRTSAEYVFCCAELLRLQRAYPVSARGLLSAREALAEAEARRDFLSKVRDGM